MNCPNCGFKTDQNFCPMCGTKTNNTENTNPYINNEQNTTPVQPIYTQQQPVYNPVTPQPLVPQQPFAPQANANPQPFVPQQPFAPQANANPQPFVPQQPFAPQANANPQPFLPQQPFAPQTNVGQTPNMPVEPAVKPAKAKKKHSKAAVIVAVSVIAAFVIAGIVINVCSYCFSARSVVTLLDELDNTHTDYSTYDDTTPDYSDMLFDEGDSVELPSGILKLNKHSVDELDTANKEIYGSNYKHLKLEFEYTNTKTKARPVDGSYCMVFPSDDTSVSFENLYYTNGNQNEVNIEPNKTESFTSDFAVPDEADSVIVQFDDFAFATNSYYQELEHCQFEIKLK